MGFQLGKHNSTPVHPGGCKILRRSSLSAMRGLLLAASVLQLILPQAKADPSEAHTASGSLFLLGDEVQSRLDEQRLRALLSAPAPAQVNSGSYNVSLPPYEIQWSQADIDLQRTAGTQLLQDLGNALASNAKQFTIQPGTYRINSSLSIEGTTNFTLLAIGAQIIVETQTLHFDLGGNTNLTLQGPMTLDGSPFGFTQGVILGTDNATQLTVCIMDGYEPPNLGRVMFFTPQAALLPLYQINIASVQSVDNQPGVYNLTMPDSFWGGFAEARGNAIKTGNLIGIEQQVLAGGINLHGNNGVNLNNITIHTYSLTFGRGESGLVSIQNLRGVRRPGTNRLVAGGFVAMSLLAGSLRMIDSELSYNFDDLTDIESNLAYAFNQTSPTTLYIGFEDPPEVGAVLTFYNAATMANDGTANITSIQTVTDSNIISNFQNGLTALGVLNWNVVPSLIRLNKAVNISKSYDFVDYMPHQGRANSIVFQNCFIHDGLSAGLNAKGAKSIVIRNNTVVRTGYRGASVGYDPYWWEGGIPANILIEGNIIDSVPYNVIDTGQSISTYVDTSSQLLAQATASPIHNVTIRNNTILNPPVAAIGLSFSANNTVTGNTIIQPVAAIADKSIDHAQPYTDASAIFIDTVAGSTYILNNRIIQVNPQLVPQIIRLGYTTKPTGFSLCNNTQVLANGAIQAVPNEFWNSVGPDSSMIAYSQPFSNDHEHYISIGDRFNDTFTFHQTSSVNATASYSFTGTRARFYSCVGPRYGLASIKVDTAASQTIDASVIGLPDIIPEININFCGQMLFDTGTLSDKKHKVTITVLGKSGAQSQNGASSVAVVSFDYLKGTSLCGSLGSGAKPSVTLYTLDEPGASPEISALAPTSAPFAAISPEPSVLPATSPTPNFP